MEDAAGQHRIRVPVRIAGHHVTAIIPAVREKSLQPGNAEDAEGKKQTVRNQAVKVK